MASETVRVFVVDQQTPTPDPIESVLVRMFNAAGDTFISQDYTDASGIADFTLDGDDPPNEYTIRLSKTGVAFDGALGDDSKSPQLIQVYSPPTAAPNNNNDFEVQGETFERPVATSARMCRASGFFKSGNGQPYANLDIVFTPRFDPTIVDGDGVINTSMYGRTDDDGYLEIDLYRGGEYSAMIEGLQDELREMVVPDQSSANLVELLFPVVAQVVFDPTSLAMSAGDEEEVTVIVTGSDNRILTGTAPTDVQYTVADESVATVAVQNDQIVITAVAAGTTQIDVSRLDESVVVIPETPIVYTPLPITVT